MATYAIGDIQGCYNTLMALLDKVEFDSNKDKLWLAGDLVNRGPNSLQVMEYVMSLGKRATVVLGNHDFYLLAVHYDAWPMRPTTTLKEILTSPKAEEIIDWLKHKPLLHVDKKLGYAMTHAGLYPGWTLEKAQALADEVHQTLTGENIATFLAEMYGNNPNKWSDDLSGNTRLRFIVNAFTRMRYVTEDLQLNLHHKEQPDKAPSRLVPWFSHPKFKLPDGLQLLFGHWASLGGYESDKVIGLDTGCAWGFQLTAMRLEDKKLFSVVLQD